MGRRGSLVGEEVGVGGISASLLASAVESIWGTERVGITLETGPGGLTAGLRVPTASGGEAEGEAEGRGVGAAGGGVLATQPAGKNKASTVSRANSARRGARPML